MGQRDVLAPTQALDILINALANAIHINQTFATISTAENVLRGFIKNSSATKSVEPIIDVD